MGKVRQRLGLTLSVFSLLLLSFIGSCYLFRWDSVAALTNFPIWITGLLGLTISAVAHLLFGAKLGLSSLLAWMLSILLIADEPRFLVNFSNQKPSRERSEPDEQSNTLRIVTLNCHSQRNSLDIDEIASFNPDIVFLQELISSSEARRLQKKLYTKKGHLQTSGSCAILSRYPLSNPKRIPGLRSIIAIAHLQDGSALNLVNLHLSSSTSRMDLWNPEAWQDHTQIRQKHRTEVKNTLNYLYELGLDIESTPTILAGDLNSKAGDPALDALESNFTDTFHAAGKGWSNTYPANFPLLRIDYIFSNRKLSCKSATTLRINGTDHRMVLADFKVKTSSTH